MINPVAFSIFGLDIYWYGISYIVSFTLGLQLIKYYSKKYINLILTEQELEDILLFICISVVLGGRIGCFLFYEDTIFTLDIFRFRDGGMSFHGGLIGGLIGIFLFCKKYQKLFFHITDLISVSAPIGLFFGRIANYINDNEIRGKIIAGFEHPVVLYESLFEGIVLFAILNLTLKNNVSKKGKSSSLFLIYYGVFRFFLDFLKDQPEICKGLNMGQLLCIPMIIFGFYLYKKSN